jgi:DNA-binding winged helix-turn-helix (wHTH) protein/dipeptidyl aminopeptidase/acylaminoacyl peptidase
MSQNHGGWIVRFGVYEANLRSGELRKQGIRVKLQEQPFQVLAMLLEKPGEIVTREEMRQRLWPQDTFVDFDHSLNKAINKVRDALCDSAENPRFVETLARRGYRFLAPVHYPDPGGKHSEDSVSSPAMIRADASAGQSGSDPKTTNATTMQEPIDLAVEPVVDASPWLLRHIWINISFGLLTVTLAAYLFRPEMPAPRIARVVRLTNDEAERSTLYWGRSMLFFVAPPEGVNRIFQMPDDGASSPQDISNFFPGKVFSFKIWNVSIDGNRLLLTFFEKNGSDWKTESPLWSFDFRNQAMQRVGNLKGRWFRMSPDEKKIAFLNGKDLYLAEADGSQLKEIYSFKNESYLWRWNSDCKTLRGYFLAQGFPMWDIDLDGTDPRQILPNWKFEPGGVGEFTWDGKYYVFSAGKIGSERYQLWAHNEKADFFHRQRQEPTQLTVGPDSLAFPMTASKIAPIIFATSNRKRGAMMCIDLKSGKRIPFLGGISADCLDFSKDGEWVVYVTYPEYEMWRSRRDGSEKLKLTAQPNLSWLPRWSPDGTKIAFHYKQQLGKPWKIAIIPRDGGEPKILIPGTETDVDPNWSPDGTKIVYSLPRDPTKIKEGKIRILDLNSRKIIEVPGSQGLWYSRWSPDGKYLSAHDIDMKLKLYEFKTNCWTELVHFGCGFPNWSRDEKFIQVIQPAGNPNPGIYRAWIADGKVERVVDLREIKMAGNLYEWLGMTPEGDPLILESRDSNEIFAYHLEY